jgi:hypothetical protein
MVEDEDNRVFPADAAALAKRAGRSEIVIERGSEEERRERRGEAKSGTRHVRDFTLTL